MSEVTPSEIVSRFLTLFGERSKDGTPRFSREDLLAFLPVLLKSIDLEGPLPASLEGLVAEAAKVLGITPGMSAAEAERQWVDHCRQRPGPVEVARRVLRELDAAGLDTRPAAQSLAALISRPPPES